MTPKQAVARARSALGHDVAYKLGAGGYGEETLKPEYDCSGFVAWVFRVHRKLPEIGWLETTLVWKDITGAQLVFEQARAQVGAVIVYPDVNGKQGHIGIVTEMGDVLPRKVIHASATGWRTHADAIQETGPKVWLDRPDTVFGMWKGYEKEPPMDEKKWWQSKTVWGAVVALATTGLNLAGYSLSVEDQGLILGYVDQLLQIGGGLFAIYGRATAKTVITK